MLRRLIKRIVYFFCKCGFAKKVTLLGTHYNVGPSAKVILADGSNKKCIVIGDYVDCFGLLYSQSGGDIIVGNNVMIGRNVQIRSGQLVKIGNNSIISENVIITDNNNHPISVRFRYAKSFMPSSSEMHLWKWSRQMPVIIKENTWLGENSRVCKGVTVGKNSIVAANAVVTKDVPDNCIVAGNPAKIVKTDINLLPDPKGCKEFDLFWEHCGKGIE